MPSPSQHHSPYKSKLFNFLNRQYIRINDQIGTRARQLKSLASWAWHSLLYPLYFLASIGRRGKKGFHPGSEARQPNLREDSNQTSPPSNLISNSTATKLSELPGSPPQPFLASLDNLIANWENGNLFKPQNLTDQNSIQNQAVINNPQKQANDNDIERKKSNNFSIKELIVSAIDYFLGGHRPNLNLGREENSEVIDGRGIERDPFQIQRLIWAAIDYYFFNHKSNSSLSSTAEEKIEGKSIATNSLPLCQQEIIEDPWLSWHDLYGESMAGQEEQIDDLGERNSNSRLSGDRGVTHHYLLVGNNDLRQNVSLNQVLYPNHNPSPQVVQQSKTDKKMDQFIQDNQIRKPKIQKKRKQKETRSPTKNPAKINLHRQTSKNTSDQVNSLGITNGKLLVTSGNTKNIKNSTETQAIEPMEANLGRELDWLEAKVVDSGYEKHFLQIILEGLDIIIVRVEEFLLKIWLLFKKLLKKLIQSV